MSKVVHLDSRSEAVLSESDESVLASTLCHLMLDGWQLNRDSVRELMKWFIPQTNSCNSNLLSMVMAGKPSWSDWLAGFERRWSPMQGRISHVTGRPSPEFLKVAKKIMLYSLKVRQDQSSRLWRSPEARDLALTEPGSKHTPTEARMKPTPIETTPTKTRSKSFLSETRLSSPPIATRSNSTPMETRSKPAQAETRSKNVNSSNRIQNGVTNHKADAGAAGLELSSSEVFQVERILAIKLRPCRDGKEKERLYLVKWKDFPFEDNSWEPRSNLNCDESLQIFESFWQELTMRQRSCLINAANCDHTSYQALFNRLIASENCESLEMQPMTSATLADPAGPDRIREGSDVSRSSIASAFDVSHPPSPGGDHEDVTSPALSPSVVSPLASPGDDREDTASPVASPPVISSLDSRGGGPGVVTLRKDRNTSRKVLSHDCEVKPRPVSMVSEQEPADTPSSEREEPVTVQIDPLTLQSRSKISNKTRESSSAGVENARARSVSMKAVNRRRRAGTGYTRLMLSPISNLSSRSTVITRAVSGGRLSSSAAISLSDGPDAIKQPVFANRGTAISAKHDSVACGTGTQSDAVCTLHSINRAAGLTPSDFNTPVELQRTHQSPASSSMNTTAPPATPAVATSIGSDSLTPSMMEAESRDAAYVSVPPTSVCSADSGATLGDTGGETSRAAALLPEPARSADCADKRLAPSEFSGFPASVLSWHVHRPLCARQPCCSRRRGLEYRPLRAANPALQLHLLATIQLDVSDLWRRQAALSVSTGGTLQCWSSPTRLRAEPAVPSLPPGHQAVAASSLSVPALLPSHHVVAASSPSVPALLPSHQAEAASSPSVPALLPSHHAVDASSPSVPALLPSHHAVAASSPSVPALLPSHHAVAASSPSVPALLPSHHAVAASSPSVPALLPSHHAVAASSPPVPALLPSHQAEATASSPAVPSRQVHTAPASSSPAVRPSHLVDSDQSSKSRVLPSQSAACSAVYPPSARPGVARKSGSVTSAPPVSRGGSRPRKRRRGTGDCFSILRKRHKKPRLSGAASTAKIGRASQPDTGTNTDTSQSESISESADQSERLSESLDQSERLSESVDQSERLSECAEQSRRLSQSVDESERLTEIKVKSERLSESVGERLSEPGAARSTDEKDTRSMGLPSLPEPCEVEQQVDDGYRDATEDDDGGSSDFDEDDDDDDDGAVPTDAKQVITVFPPIVQSFEGTQKWRSLDLETVSGVVHITVVPKIRDKDNTLRPLSKTTRKRIGFSEFHDWLECVALPDVIKYVMPWPRPNRYDDEEETAAAPPVPRGPGRPRKHRPTTGTVSAGGATSASSVAQLSSPDTNAPSLTPVTSSSAPPVSSGSTTHAQPPISSALVISPAIKSSSSDSNIRSAAKEEKLTIPASATSAVPTRHVTAASGTAVRHVTASSGTPVRHVTAASGTAVRHVTAASGTAVRHVTAASGTAVRHVTAASGTAVRHVTASSGTPVRHVTVSADKVSDVDRSIQSGNSSIACKQVPDSCRMVNGKRALSDVRVKPSSSPPSLKWVSKDLQLSESDDDLSDAN